MRDRINHEREVIVINQAFRMSAKLDPRTSEARPIRGLDEGRRIEHHELPVDLI